MTRVFISFVHEDATVAKAVQRLIRDTLGLYDEVFLSSDAIQAGDLWLEKIRDALESCEVLLSLLSARSVQRPWINFETGAAWIQKRLVIPVCYGALSLGSLQEPYRTLQAVQIPRQAKNLISAIQDRLRVLPPKQPEEDNPFLAARRRWDGVGQPSVEQIMEDPYANLAFAIKCWSEESR
jgi:hypothetical protein